MKKLLALAIAVSTPALADVYTDVNYKNSDQVSEAAAKVGYVMDNGLSVDLENVYDFKNKENKEITLGTAWKYEIIENGYIQPLAEVTFATNNTEDVIFNDTKEKIKLTEKAEKGTTYKFGIKGGYDFDNGIYTSLRYRYEMNNSDWNVVATGHDGKTPRKHTLLGEENANRLHRTDLTVGYVIEDIADLSVNWIYKKGSVKVKNTVLDSSFDTTKLNASSSDIELKAAANGLGDFVPYIQYTIKSDVKVKDFDIAGENFKGEKVKAENEIKVGLVYNF